MSRAAAQRSGDTPADQTPAADTRAGALPIGPVIDSRTLFCFSRVLTIEHGGERYALRLTRANKLILTK
ncbi:MAG: hemin uptake protein HemP [Betaproteobacteria bacterium]|nr:hemin uptake protein HemP [Betaproteobacteria bacterium]